MKGIISGIISEYSVTFFKYYFGKLTKSVNVYHENVFTNLVSVAIKKSKINLTSF